MQELYKELHNCTRGPAHDGLPIIMICLQKGCARKRLCCLSCIDQIHIKHQLMSLKKFYGFVEETVNHNLNVKNRDEMIQSIQNAHEGMNNCLEKIENAFHNKLKQARNKIDTHFKLIKESYVHEKLQNVCDNVREQFTDEKIEEYYQLIKKAEGNLSRPLEQIQKSIAATEKCISEKVVLFIKEIDKSSDNIIKEVLQFKIAKSENNKVIFSPTSKSMFLSIEGEGKLAKRTQGAGGYPIALVNHPFTPDNNKIAFKIVEQPNAKGIWMGVCVQDIVKNFNFQSCYGIGKGTWGIDQVGQNHASAYSWSHHDTNFNSAPKVGWQFRVDDLVQITVDFDKSVAKFTKNKLQNYEQPIKLDLGPIYAFAGPTHINDTISLI